MDEDCLYSLSPVMFLMKTCMVGSGSADEARDETGERDDMEETLLERMMRGRCVKRICWSRRDGVLVEESRVR